MKSLITILLLITALNATAQNSLKFDGVDDKVVAPQSGPTGGSSRTIEAWAIMTTVISSQTVLVNYGDMANGHRFTLNIINGLPRIEVGGSGFSSTTALTANTWHHLAGVYDSTSNQLFLYVDGVLKASGSPIVAVNTSNLSGITIGCRIDSINYFEGLIDEVRVWNTARSQSEIAANMNKEFCSAVNGLVAYYTFNQGMASGNNSGVTTLNDLSGNNNNGTLYNFALSGTSSNWVTGKALSANATSTINANACNSYTSPSGLYTYTFSGIYFDTIPSSGGCDSIITINLLVFSLDTSVTVTGSTLFANQSLGGYQWLDCNNGYVAIPGATSQSFSPTVNGSYAVRIIKNICTDTSSCYQILNVGINENQIQSNIKVFPNPFNDKFSLHADKNLNGSIVRIYNIQGVLILEKIIDDSSKMEFDLSSNSSGFYSVEVITPLGTFHQKLTKK